MKILSRSSGSQTRRSLPWKWTSSKKTVKFQKTIDEENVCFDFANENLQDTLRTVATHLDDVSIDSTFFEQSISSISARRRVQFNDDMTTTFEFETEEFTKEEKQSLWMSKADIKDNVETAKKEAVYQLQNRKVYSQSFQASVSKCFRCNCPAALEDCEFLSQSTARGLELRMSPKLNDKRKKHIKSIIQLQSKLQRRNDIDAQALADEIAGKSLKQTQPFSAWAQTLGQGDAIVAH